MAVHSTFAVAVNTTTAHSAHCTYMLRAIVCEWCSVEGAWSALLLLLLACILSIAGIAKSSRSTLQPSTPVHYCTPPNTFNKLHTSASQSQGSRAVAVHSLSVWCSTLLPRNSDRVRLPPLSHTLLSITFAHSCCCTPCTGRTQSPLLSLPI